MGVIKEIFSRPSSTELMKTMRSLTQSAARFCVNQYRVAVECSDAVLRELMLVSLQGIYSYVSYNRAQNICTLCT